MPAPLQQPKASASDKTRANDRGWLSAKELAAAIGWRTHTLRDALRGRRIPGITLTSYGYYIDASAVPSIAQLLGPAPAKIRKKDQAPLSRPRS